MKTYKQLFELELGPGPGAKAGMPQGSSAGDAIVIPTNLDYDPPLNRVSAITSVVFQSLTSIVAFLNITKQ